MAGVSLKKGERVNLTKDLNIKKAMIGLGWDTNRYQGSQEFDLDLVIFECNKNAKCLDNQHLIYYNNLEDPEHAIKHSGDNRTGAGDGDDETAFIDFAKINPNAERVVVAVTIYEARERGQSFGQVDNAFIRLVDAEKSGSADALRYDLGEKFSTQKSVIFAEFYKNSSGDWFFRSVGEGYDKELVDLCHEYGIEVAD